MHDAVAGSFDCRSPGRAGGQGLLAAEHGHDVEHRGEVARPVSAARSGWAPCRASAPCSRRMRAPRLPCGSAANPVKTLPEPAISAAMRSRPPSASSAAALARAPAAARREVVGAVEELDQRLGALLQGGMAAASRRSAASSIESARSRATGRPRAGSPDAPDSSSSSAGACNGRSRAPAWRSRTGPASADAVEIEPRDHLLGREDLLVAVAPAQPDE